MSAEDANEEDVNCPFCQIDKEKTRVIEERERVVVVLSNPRLLPGHTLVIPRRHVEKPSEMTPEERMDVFDTLFEYQNKIVEQYSTGCDIRQNYRPFLAQSWVKVNHVHFHLLPRELEDELYERSMKFEKEMWTALPEEEREKFTQLLRLQT